MNEFSVKNIAANVVFAKDTSLILVDIDSDANTIGDKFILECIWYITCLMDAP